MNPTNKLEIHFCIRFRIRNVWNKRRIVSNWRKVGAESSPSPSMQFPRKCHFVRCVSQLCWLFRRIAIHTHTHRPMAVYAEHRKYIAYIESNNDWVARCAWINLHLRTIIPHIPFLCWSSSLCMLWLCRYKRCIGTHQRGIPKMYGRLFSDDLFVCLSRELRKRTRKKASEREGKGVWEKSHPMKSLGIYQLELCFITSA